MTTPASVPPPPPRAGLTRRRRQADGVVHRARSFGVGSVQVVMATLAWIVRNLSQIARAGFQRLATSQADRVTAGYLTVVLTLSLLPVACHGPIVSNSRSAPQANGSPAAPVGERTGPQAALPSPMLDSIKGEPMVRVRIESGVAEVALRAESALIFRVFPDAGAPYELPSAATIRVTNEGFRLTPQGASDRSGGTGALDWPAGALSVRAADGGAIRIGDRQYPGRLVLHRRTDANARMDVINHAPLEIYVTGVITKELYGNWHLEAFKAQAVAARSYFFFEQHRNARRHYDLESTTASQVYAGASSNPTALAAGRATAGQVLTWNGQVLPTFYSADNGRFGADAARVFPYMPDVPPLRGSVHTDVRTASPHQSWTITRDTATFARRVAAWGRARNHAIAALDGITRIEVASTNTAGRPNTFRIVDRPGRPFEIRAESLRLAGNFKTNALPDVGNTRLKSSALIATVSPDGRSIIFRGEGYGHGVGLSQWGAQTLAAEGQSYQQILANYYPGARLSQAY